MREIKFRAWDGKKLHQWDSTDHGAVDQIISTPYPKLFYLPMSWLVGDSNDWKWMQYTGLKDKNGKEIYEGDIVEKADHKGHFAQVWWNNNDSSFKFDWGKSAGKFVDIQPYYHLEVEIIGNIYENSELIEK